MAATEKRPYYDLDEIKNIPMEEVCAALGIEVTNRGGGKWFSIRSEKTPSCKIYPTNTYADFGNGNKGGSVINLVAEYNDLDNAAAILWLGEQFGIRSANQVTGRNDIELTDRQYAIIGIQADMATKNFDIDLESYTEEQTRAFVEQYRMDVRELAVKHPDKYHQMLRSISVPLLYEKRNEYYRTLFIKDTFFRSITGTSVMESAEAMKELEALLREVRTCEMTLRRAIKDSNLLRFKWATYDIMRDLERIRAGELSFEIYGNTPYVQLKIEADKQGGRVAYCQMEHDTYLDVCAEEILGEIGYAVYLKGDKVNIAYLAKDKAVIETLKKVAEEKEQAARAKK